jgi:ribonuclease HI
MEGFEGGWAFVAIHGERRLERYRGGYPSNGSIGMMEMYAIYASLVTLTPTGLKIQIFSDSSYCVNALTVWYKKWRRRGWLTAAGKPVAHRPLIDATLLEMDRHRASGSEIEMIHVRGHRGLSENERADYLAGHARRTGETNLKPTSRLFNPARNAV